jgi:hypothetical protein
VAALPVCIHLTGSVAHVMKYVRANERCPADSFLDSLDPKMCKRFAGQFDAISKMGSEYENHQRFTPLRGRGKPLWEFKEHDHRLYCFRRVLQARAVLIVLFGGWIKQKAGRTDKEDREIERAMQLYNDFMNEYPGGNV